MKQLFLVLLLPFGAFAQRDTLDEVVLHGQTIPKEQAFPAQHLNKENLNALNATSVADATKFLPGVLIKDYGGLGGLKTISVRSLGSQHTAVMYDGMVWSDAQNGQTDLGKLSIENIDKISLYYAQPDVLLVPARALAAGSVLSLQTSAMKKENSQSNIFGIFRTGSFGLFNPAFSFKRIFSNTSHKLSGEWMKSDGDYKYPSFNNSGEKVKRINTLAKNARAEYDFTFQPTDSNKLHLKLYYYWSDKELPGAVIFNNTDADDYVKDQHAMAQLSWKNFVNDKSSFLLNAKYHYLQSHYVDPSFNNVQGKLDNNFHQYEMYLSGTYAYDFTKELSAAVSTDLFHNKLNRTDSFAINFRPVERLTMLNALNLQWKKKYLMMQGGGVFTYMKDRVNGVSDDKKEQVFSFFAGINARPIHQLPLTFRLSYKEAFRAPTFNDLYFTLVGNTALKPEDANMFNVGVTYHYKSNHLLNSFIISTDFYHNNVQNKIQALPRQSLFQWSMVNVGKVEINGMDIQTEIRLIPFRNWKLDIRGTYTYQQARDVTDPAASNYKQQLPYTPEHSGSAMLQAKRNRFSIGYSVLFSGYRYRQGDQIPDNFLEGYVIQDVKLTYQFKEKFKFNTTIFAEINNIGNQQYDIIRYYPMPGTHFRLGFTINHSSIFKN